MAVGEWHQLWISRFPISLVFTTLFVDQARLFLEKNEGHITARRECVCQQTQRGHCFPWSLSPGDGGTMKKPLMEEAAKVKKESDRKQGKTRGSGWEGGHQCCVKVGSLANVFPLLRDPYVSKPAYYDNFTLLFHSPEIWVSGSNWDSCGRFSLWTVVGLLVAAMLITLSLHSGANSSTGGGKVAKTCISAL